MKSTSSDTKYSKIVDYGSFDANSMRTESVSSEGSTQEPLAVRQQRAARKQLDLHPIDDDASLKKKSSNGDKKKSKKGKLGRIFDMSSLATPVAAYSMSAEAAANDPNVYWDEEAGVWRYWYYTWCPIF